MDNRQMLLLTFDQPLSDFDIFRVVIPNEFFTRKMLADRLGRAKSPSLITRLNRLTSEGFFSVVYHALPNQVDMWVYSLTEAGVEARSVLLERHAATDGEAFRS